VTLWWLECHRILLRFLDFTFSYETQENEAEMPYEMSFLFLLSNLLYLARFMMVSIWRVLTATISFEYFECFGKQKDPRHVFSHLLNLEKISESKKMKLSFYQLILKNIFSPGWSFSLGKFSDFFHTAIVRLHVHKLWTEPPKWIQPSDVPSPP